MKFFFSKKFKKLQSSILLIFAGLVIFSFGAVNYYRIRILSFSKVPESAVRMGERPTQIIIPSINVDLPIDEGEIKDGVWQISYKNATHLSTSANPKGGGNIVIYGHNKKVIFGNLPYLKVGEKISIKTSDGNIYQYKVTEKTWVTPSRVDLVSPTNTEQLTIYTCWGLFDNQRVVVKAIPII